MTEHKNILVNEGKIAKKNLLDVAGLPTYWLGTHQVLLKRPLSYSPGFSKLKSNA